MNRLRIRTNSLQQAKLELELGLSLATEETLKMILGTLPPQLFKAAKILIFSNQERNSFENLVSIALHVSNEISSTSFLLKKISKFAFFRIPSKNTFFCALRSSIPQYVIVHIRL